MAARVKYPPVPGEEELVRNNINLVWHLVKHKYYNLPDEDEDLFQIGCIGLLRAVRKYDSTKQAAFGTYAYRCIQTEINNHMRTKMRQKRHLEDVNVSLTNEWDKDDKQEEDRQDYLAIIETAYEHSENKITLVNLLKKNWSKFSPREKEVLTLVLFGYRNIEIAQLFGIHKGNVNFFLNRVYAKVRRSMA